MRVKYNRISHNLQSGSGRRFTNDLDYYDLTLLDKVSGTVAFKDRPKGGELLKLVANGKVTEIVIEEFSRIGRNTGDVINTLLDLDEKKINVVVRNLGLQSRPNGERNPIWNMISSVMSSLYAMELENIRERTSIGRLVYVQNGGKLGRPIGTTENDKKFLEKPASLAIIKGLKKGLTVREVAKVASVSTKTVMKVKSLAKATD
ncbi:DNA invertase Pin-like site-specific DNA recombinase [Mucilaginibacter sp. UYP25]|uniref:recombinase family protein n=1 Tax=unclassified Mucilaginibacter TaxID=2617802 RepID=UPI003396E052